MNIFDRVQMIFRDILANDELIIEESLKIGDIEGWDSFAQINILAACEAEFKIKFFLEEIAGLKSVNAIVESIREKVQS